MRLKLAMLLALATCACQDSPYKTYPFTGTVQELKSTPNGDGHWCTDMQFQKADGAIVVFSLSNWPPAWKGMHAEILLREDSKCGYSMTSAREIK